MILNYDIPGDPTLEIEYLTNPSTFTSAKKRVFLFRDHDSLWSVKTSTGVAEIIRVCKNRAPWKS